MKLYHKGKVIGELKGKHLYKKGGQVVLFRNLDGFGMSKDVLDLFYRVTLTYKGVGYTARSEDFWEHGIPYNFNGDEQLILPRSRFTYKNKDQGVLL